MRKIGFIGKDLLVFMAMCLFLIIEHNSIYQSIVWAIAYLLVIQYGLPIAHEFFHLVAYFFFRPGVKGSIHRTLNSWYVLVEDEGWYHPNEMMVILLMPLGLTILSLVVYFLCGNTDINVKDLSIFVGLLNTLGMLGGVRTKGDLRQVFYIALHPYSLYRFEKNGEMVEYQIIEKAERV